MEQLLVLFWTTTTVGDTMTGHASVPVQTPLAEHILLPLHSSSTVSHRYYSLFFLLLLLSNLFFSPSQLNLALNSYCSLSCSELFQLIRLFIPCLYQRLQLPILNTKLFQKGNP